MSSGDTTPPPYPYPWISPTSMASYKTDMSAFNTFMPLPSGSISIVLPSFSAANNTEGGPINTSTPSKTTSQDSATLPQPGAASSTATGSAKAADSAVDSSATFSPGAANSTVGSPPATTPHGASPSP